MSSGGAFGGARGYQPRPPEKGVFPLDHFGECKQVGAHRACQEVALLLLSASAVSLKALSDGRYLQPASISAAYLRLCSLPPGPARAAIAARSSRTSMWRASRRTATRLMRARRWPGDICSAGWRGAPPQQQLPSACSGRWPALATPPPAAPARAEGVSMARSQEPDGLAVSRRPRVPGGAARRGGEAQARGQPAKAGGAQA